jgi:hypothetical protein
MRTGGEPEKKRGGLMGIRPGVWAFAIATFLLCTMVSFFNVNSSAPLTSVRPTAEPQIARQTTSSHQRSSEHRHIAFTAEQARQFACALANERAKELYKCEPFSDGAAPDFIDGVWKWSNCRGHGLVDFEASVEFGADGSDPFVFILVLDNRTLQVF